MSKKNYSDKREEQHILNRIKSDKEFNRLIEEEYERALIEIKNEIQIAVEGFARKENISIIEAKKRISKMDVKSFEKKANEYVLNKDFSKRANEELRLYNVTMRTSRLQLLQKRIELSVIKLAQKEDDLLRYRLARESTAEIKRQAGILGLDTPSQKKISKTVSSYIDADFHSAKFSDRIWYNNKELISTLERGIERSLLRGENPSKWVNNLYSSVKKGVDSAKYEATRLAVTEVGRMQTLTQKESLIEGGFENYVFIAEPGACPICKPLNDKVFKLKELSQGTNAPMMHPWCRCSIAATMEDVSKDMFNYNPKEELDRTQYNKYKDILGSNIGLTFDDFKNMKYNGSEKWNDLKLKYRKLNAYEKIVKHEPAITRDLKEIAKSTKTKLIGLEFRLKSKDSYLRKIDLNSNSSKNQYIVQNVISDTKDIIRYTYESKLDSLTNDYFNIDSLLKDRGYKSVKVKNYWLNKRNPYNGVNCNYKNTNGQVFEIQFHTKESFDLKNNEMHKLYEKARDKKTTEKELIEINKKMFELSNKLKRPNNIERIK